MVSRIVGSRGVRVALITAGGLVGLIALGIGAVVWTNFAGLAPVADGDRVGGVDIVKDGYALVYVIDGGPGAVVLVDAGNDAGAAAIDAGLARAGRTRADVAGILLTHAHPDHVAGIAAIGAPVHALAAERELLVDAIGRPADVEHADGDVFTVGPTEVRGFAVPGHTPGSAAWLVDGVLYVGDSANATADGHVVGGMWIFTSDRAQNDASMRGLAERVAPYGVTDVAFGHTGPVPFSALEAYGR